MNKRIAAVLLLALVIAGFVYWRLHKTSFVGSQPTNPDSGVSESTSNPPTVRPRGSNTGTNARGTKLEQAVNAKNVPIHFWGKVVDENGTPLVGVKVRSHVRRWQSYSSIAAGSSDPTQENSSSSDGTFEIDGGAGDVLTIDSLEKEGYDPEPGSLRWFGFNLSTNVVVSREQPVVFRMWKQGRHESLVSGDKPFHLEPDGRVYTVDLLNGEIVENANAPGDLRIAIERPAGAKLGQRYDWNGRIVAVGGGLVEEPDVYSSMYLAPEAGYTNDFHFGYLASDQPWSDGFSNRRYYLRSREGALFGRLTLDVYAYYNNKIPARIRIRYAVNPSGSRVLR